MAIYFMFFPVIGLFYLATNNQMFKSRKLFVFLSFAFLGLFSALRATTVGTDTHTYEMLFMQADRIIAEKSPLYDIFSDVIRLISQDPHAITVANSLLIALLLGLFVYWLPVNPLYATFFLISLNFYLPSLNTARQFIALGFVINGFLLLMHKRTFWYLVMILLGTGFHSTALLGLVYLLVAKVRWTKVRVTILSVVTAIVAALYIQISNVLIKVIPGFNIYASGSESGADTNLNQASQGSGMIIIFNILLFLILVIYFCAFYYTNQEMTHFQISVSVLFLIGTIVGIVNGNVILLQRSMVYFMIFGVVIFSELPALLARFVVQKVPARIIVFAALFGMSFVQYTYQLTRNNGNIIPYVLH
ncbi:hypothetical protein JOC36_001556 [Weissella uvarum]|uniref:EpsG family protein n=1 Tax=Weissella uvarum TaxID=1479233 RepID=UPI001961F3C5|nr:EpsG family protein [Weissella uvarum]MBM7617962.1 hypothetical protein [Weissella uvarum]MCM0596181.1 EpsG family protein [Weissella uvarum]